MQTEINYKSCLNEFKKSMEGGSEFEMLIDGISKNIPTNRIRWLEIGIGDGHYLKKIVNRLEMMGYVIEVTGVDCSKESTREAKKIFPNSQIINQDFLDISLEGKFDVCSFNQSIYYFHNKRQVIDKCKENLAEGGLIVNVCWSDKDSIYKYHKKVFGEWTLGGFSSEDFINLVSSYADLNVAYDELFKGRVNFGLWRNKSSLIKNLQVISRIPLSRGTPATTYEYASKMLSKFRDNEIRVNEVVIAKKSYKIKNLDRPSIELNLKKRFPNYKHKVSKVRGDLEALFMCSWEKETEYLSSYIPSGRVLEICCAAGLKTVILAKYHNVIAIDINESRLRAAKHNAVLFGVNNNTKFLNVNADNKDALIKLGQFDAIFVDVDWRENLSDPIKKQNINPFKTSPATDRLYKNLRNIYPDIPIIFKVSPFVRVKKMLELDPCIIEELYIDGKFLSYNVYYSKFILEPRWQEIHLLSKDLTKE